ncbi:MAG: hypothetical protein ABR572_03900 [Cryomorphaceae bacterium]|nr:hypothetical protein [Flavobacteriales bacterium]
MIFEIRPVSAEKHLLEITFRFTATSSLTELQIPYWRPGRYEGGNFPRNYIGIKAYFEGVALPCRKITGHRIAVETPQGKEITVQYEYYAADLTAGNTYYDGDVLLVNPVNCLLYPTGLEKEPFTLSLALPEAWDCATTLKAEDDQGDISVLQYRAGDLQELLDTPLLAAADLKNYSYIVEGVKFHIDVSGYFPENPEGIIGDFRAFTETQLRAFGSFPVDEYRFLLLFLPARARHGVEHEKSTVIVMGPAAELETKEMYNSLLGIASHELYHTWNVKYLRPADWTPYDFTGPSFSRLGYVAEGVTTYMGDLMLWQAGVFDDDEFLTELSGHLDRFMQNTGRHNLSLADSSIDTWVDGYGRTAPGRRQSIYTEGALLAFVCDAMITDGTDGDAGLWKAMRKLYETVNPSQGFTEDEYWAALAKEANKPWTALREAVVDGTGALENFIEGALPLLGLKSEESGDNKKETWWGEKHIETPGNGLLVIYVAANSPAETCGLWPGNLIEAVNGTPAADFFRNATESVLRNSSVELTVKKGYKTRTLTLVPDGNAHLKKYSITQNPAGNTERFHTWKTTLQAST